MLPSVSTIAHPVSSQDVSIPKITPFLVLQIFLEKKNCLAALGDVRSLYERKNIFTTNILNLNKLG